MCAFIWWEATGILRGHFIILEGSRPIVSRLWSVSRQSCLFASFQENGSNPNTRAGQRPGLFNHLEAQTATAAVRRTRHSWFAKDAGPGACPGRMYSQIDTWFGESQWDPPSQGVTMKRPLSKGDSSTEGSGQGKEGSTGIQLDHHLQPCLLTMCSGGMLFTNNPDVSETFPSQVYILNVLHSSWREGNKCPHSMQIYLSSNGGLTCDEVVPWETVLKKRGRD